MYNQYSQYSAIDYFFIPHSTLVDNTKTEEDPGPPICVPLKDAKEFAIWSVNARMFKDVTKSVTVHVEDYQGQKIGFARGKWVNGEVKTIWVKYW